jgi:hypothetical protein
MHMSSSISHWARFHWSTTHIGCLVQFPEIEDGGAPRNVCISFLLDARFNKGLIEGCQRDISQYCKGEVVDDDNDQDSDENDDPKKDDDGKLSFY